MDAAGQGGIPERHSQRCSHCGTVLAQALEGMCPGCLLDTALGPPPSFPEDHFGDYALVKELAQGGTGVVYLARQNSLERLVALKMLTRGVLASDAEMRRIHDEAKIAASLKHPNIIPIYEVGVHEEIAYFTMPLMEGGSLAEQMPRLQGRFREAAQLLETISRAVHHGHQRGILHRDLKPANVLLDAAGVPHVADFGLARALDSEARVTQSGSVEGTLSYMAPEQAQPGDLPLTVAVDVYSLGVILYELLTSRLPFEAESFDALLARMRESRPVAPRAIRPRLPRSLEAICLKCLEKEPARRYGSAAELADELRRSLENRPVLAMSTGPLERAWMWCLRHPRQVAVLATLICTLSVAAAVTFQALLNAALLANAYSAQVIADGVLHKLEEQGRSVEDMAAQPELVAALEARSMEDLQAFCEGMFERYGQARGEQEASSRGAPFYRIFIEDKHGITLARCPVPKPPEEDFLLKDYFWRDYFQGALRQVPTKSGKAYLSRAFESEAHQRLTFALSVPVYSKEGEWLGVLSASVASDSTLGSLQLDDPGASDQTVTLVARLDRNRGQELHPHRYAVVIHKQLKERGAVLKLDDELGAQIEQALSKSPRPSFGDRGLQGYRDPESKEPGLAAFAPVGHTNFVVIKATRWHVTLAAASALVAQRLAWGSLLFALGFALGLLVFWRARFRSL